MIYATRSDGVLKGDGKSFTNADFVSEIRDDPTPMGALMRSEFPTETRITLRGDPPASWREWNDRVSLSKIRSVLSDHVEEIPADKRMTTGRKELSTRSITILTHAGMNVSPRGVSESGVPESGDQAAVWIVYGLYSLVERNTTASLRTSGATLSNTRLAKYESVINALESGANVMDMTLLSTYTEPSASMIRRMYCLGSLHGVEMVHTMINDLYHKSFSEQVKSVRQAWETIRR